MNTLPKNSTYRIVLLAIASLVLVVAVGWLYLFTVNMTMSRRLVGYNMENIKVGGHYYVLDHSVVRRIKDGDRSVPEYNPLTIYRVLKLAILYIETVEDPLFSSSALDGKKFLVEVSRTDKYNDELVKKLSLSNDIVPIAFLQTVGEVAIASENFENDITESKAKVLLSRYTEAMSEYRQATKRYIELLEGQNGKPPARFLGLITSSDLNQENISRMKQNIDLLATDVDKRARGFSMGYTSNPVPNNIKRQKVVTEIDDTSFTLLDNDKLHLPRGIDDKIPPLYVTSTACMGGVKQERPFYLFDSRLEGAMVALAKRADNNFYIKFDKDNTMNKPLLGLGIEWKAVYEGVNYLCPDNTYQAELVTLDSYIERYPSRLLASNLEERSFYDAKVRSYNSLLRLADLYEQEYLKLMEAGNQPYSNILPLIMRVNYIRGRQAGLDRLFATTFFLDSLSKLVDSNNGLTNKTYVYLHRANYSLTLFNFSPQVWRKDTAMEYAIAPSTAMESSAILDYYSLVSKVGQEQVDKINKTYLVDYYLQE